MGSYPAETIQGLTEQSGSSWWIKDDGKQLVRGRLIQAHVYHVDLVPLKLTVQGRSDPGDHGTAVIEVAQTHIDELAPKTALPVAALPHYPGEHYIVRRAKVRPCLVVGTPAPEVPKGLTQGKPGWQTAPTITVAPFYGAQSEGGKRSGFGEQLLARIKTGEYPQFIWDKVPVKGAEESILRLDHVMPVGRHHNSYRCTEYRLSDEALAIIDEWLVWQTRGVLNADGDLQLYREFLASL